MKLDIKREREVLETEKYTQYSYAYPSDLELDGNGKIVVFDIYTPTESKLVGMEEAGVGKVPEVERGGNSLQSTASIANRYRSSGVSIAMHMPNNVSSTYGSDWQTTAMGAAAGIANTASSLGELNGEMMKTAAKEGMGSMVTGIVQQLTPLNVQDARNRLMSQVKNPYMEVLFNGGINRTFSFEFKFTPRNDRESIIVREIVKQFKVHQAAEYKHQNQGLQSYLLYPSEFDITFLEENGAQNPWIHKLSTCVLTSLTVDYGADGAGFRTFKDGSPVQTTMTMEFTELEVLTKDRILEGF